MAIVRVDRAIEDNRAVMTIGNKVIKINSVEVQPVFGNYYCNKTDSVEMSGDVMFNGVIQSGISYPMTLKMPIVRHADGVMTTDEEYFQAQIVNGVITITGSVDRSGDWKVLIDRVNAALLRIGAPFKFDSEDITFLV